MKKSLLIFILVIAFIYVIAKIFSTSHDDYSEYFNQYLVFKPDKYNSGENYPLLFMLHGHSGDYTQWSEIVDLQKYTNKYSFIIVCPDGNYDSWYIDSPILKESNLNPISSTI